MQCVWIIGVVGSADPFELVLSLCSSYLRSAWLPISFTNASRSKVRHRTGPFAVQVAVLKIRCWKFKKGSWKTWTRTCSLKTMIDCTMCRIGDDLNSLFYHTVWPMNYLFPVWEVMMRSKWGHYSCQLFLSIADLDILKTQDLLEISPVGNIFQLELNTK